jgi:hypothetical protein
MFYPMLVAFVQELVLPGCELLGDVGRVSDTGTDLGTTNSFLDAEPSA